MNSIQNKLSNQYLNAYYGITDNVMCSICDKIRKQISIPINNKILYHYSRLFVSE